MRANTTPNPLADTVTRRVVATESAIDLRSRLAGATAS